jgi:succinate dehydrogenase / fumarate reductase flavoprotein subunit
MEIYPAAHYAMGGLWIDFEKAADGGLAHGSARNHASNIPGLYVCGEADYAYHGANRLGANSLLSASFSGRLAGESVVAYIKGLAACCHDLPNQVYEQQCKQQRLINESLLKCSGEENPYLLHEELGRIMNSKVGVVRDNRELDQALDELQVLRQRSRQINIGDCSGWTNQNLQYARQVQEMIKLAQVIAASARARDECRGAHYKPEFELPIPEGKFPGDPEFEAYRKAWKANNDAWLKTTLAEYAEQGPKISYAAVDTSVLPPEQPRDYR